MVKELEQSDLSDNPLCINQVFKSLGYLLNSDLNLVFIVVGTADNSVSAMTNLLDVFKLILDNKGGS